jgi:hypothetical protein
MGRRWAEIAYYLLLSIPLIYFGMLFLYAAIYYGSYYQGLSRIPFDFASLFAGAVLSLLPIATYLHLARIKHSLQQKLKEEQARRDEVEKNVSTLIETHKTQYRSLMAEFLATQLAEKLLNSELFSDLQQSDQIIKVRQLSGAYSGAQVYSFCRRKNSIPHILKVAEAGEIENEYQKFKEYVAEKLLIGPEGCRHYAWGSYAGLEYSLNWSQDNCEHLTFQDIYQACLYENTNPPVEIATIPEIIHRFFSELQQPTNWWQPEAINVPRPVNIYEELG